MDAPYSAGGCLLTKGKGHVCLPQKIRDVHPRLPRLIPGKGHRSCPQNAAIVPSIQQERLIRIDIQINGSVDLFRL